MALFLKSSSAYNFLRKYGVLLLPNPSLLKGIKNDLRCRNRGDGNINDNLLNDMKTSTNN